MNFLIRNGTIVNADASILADVRCADGKIKDIDLSLAVRKNDTVIDAEGCYVFPGAIDPHVHMQLSTPAGISSDSFYTGTKAALMGGTTTIIDFVTPAKGQKLSEAIKRRKEEAVSSLVDYSFHVSPVEWRDGMSAEIENCIKNEGLSSFKAYMAYKQTIGLSDEDLFRVMDTISRNGGILAIHSEIGDEIEALRQSYSKEGLLSPAYHALSRPASVETKAVERVVEMVRKTGCRVYIVHVSAKETLQVIADARKEGLSVYAETCPQYLFLDDSKYELTQEEAVKFIMSPPLRKKPDQDALWKAISEGHIQSIGTDHCPFMHDQKMKHVADFRKIPNGAGGVEHRLPLLYTYGVLENKLSLEKFVSLVSTNPAKIFGLFPQKGIVAEGADADIVIWDPTKENTISEKTHHQHCDFNVYEGISTKGQVKYLLSGGKLLVKEYIFNEQDQQGKFLKTNSF